MKQDTTDITIVLDRSGSMSSCQDATIKGFNEFFEAQKKEPGQAFISLFQFDDKYETVYEAKDVKEAPLLSPATFCPRGSTALLDAIGRTINSVGDRLGKIAEADRPGKVLFVIVTDGHENASREFSRQKVFDMISHQQDKYQWTFVFIGANQDAIATATSFGISVSNSMTYNSTSVGTQCMAQNLTRAVNRYRSGPSGQCVGFYTGDEQSVAKSTS